MILCTSAYKEDPLLPPAMIHGEVSVCLVDNDTGFPIKIDKPVLRGTISTQFRGHMVQLHLQALVASYKQKFKLLFRVAYYRNSNQHIPTIETFYSSSFSVASHNKVLKKLKTQGKK